MGNSIKENTQQNGEKRNKEKEPKSNPKKTKTQKWVIKWQRNKSCSKAPISCKKHIKRKKLDEKFEKVVNLKKSSPKMTTHFKIKVTWALYKAIVTFTYKKHAKQLKEGH